MIVYEHSIFPYTKYHVPVFICVATLVLVYRRQVDNDDGRAEY